MKKWFTKIEIPFVLIPWFKQVPAYVFSHIFTLLTGLASISILPRILGPEQYGTYVLIMLTANMISSIFGEWMVPTGIRFFAEMENRVWYNLGWLAFFSSSLGGIAVVGALLVNNVNKLSLFTSLSASFFTVVTLLSKPLIAYARASLQQRFIVVLAGISSLGSLLLGLSFFLIMKKLYWMVVGLSIVPSALFFFYSFKFHWFLKFPNANSLWCLLQFGIPIAITSVGGQLLQFADRYILALIGSHMDVGIYNVSYNLSDKILGISFSILFSSAYPIGTVVWVEGKRETAEKLLINLWKLFTAFAGAFIWFQAISGASLVKLLAGKIFEPPSVVPVLVAFGSWFWFTGILQHQPLEWDKRTLWITAMSLFSALLNLLLLWILIPLYGMTGAATATLVSYMVYLMLCTYLTKIRGYQVRIWRVPVIMWTGLGAFFLYHCFEGNADLWQGIVGALVYMVVNFVYYLRKGTIMKIEKII